MNGKCKVNRTPRLKNPATRRRSLADKRFFKKPTGLNSSIQSGQRSATHASGFRHAFGALILRRGGIGYNGDGPQARFPPTC